MKKILIVLMAALLVLAAVACKANEQPKAAEEQPKAAEEQPTAEAETLANEPLAGGWTPAENFGELTEERLAVFRKGMETLLGVDYVPLAYLGSQVVAGTNHVFLVKGTLVVPARPVSYALAYLYEDLQGNVKLLNIADLPIVPQADGTLALPEEGLMGGWAYVEDPAFTDEEEAKLEAALQNQVGASYAIVACVAEQVVAGMNRCLLVQVTPVVPNARPHYALAYVYTDLQGNSSLTQVIDLDIGALCTYGA